MRSESTQRPSQAAGILNQAICRVAIAVGIRTEIDDWLSKIGGWRRKSRIVVIGTGSNCNEAGIEQFVGARVICRELLRIVRASDAPGKTVMHAWPQPVELLGHIPVRSVFCGEQIAIRREGEVEGITRAFRENVPCLAQKIDIIRQNQI